MHEKVVWRRHLCKHAAYCPSHNAGSVHLGLRNTHSQQHHSGGVIQGHMHLHTNHNYVEFCQDVK